MRIADLHSKPASCNAAKVGIVDYMRKGTTTLQNGTMILRKYVLGDIQTLYENLGSDPEMLRYTGWNPYFSLESTKDFIVDIINGYEQGDTDYSWVIEDKGDIVGTIGAYEYCIEDNSIEIGYSIFKKYWGNGLAAKALSSVCEYLMNQENISVLKAWSASDNIGSLNVLEKNGFAKTKIMESSINVNGEKLDRIFFEKTSGVKLKDINN